jgi:hypothetical protein
MRSYFSRVCVQQTKANKPHYPTARSRSVYMIFRDYNLYPVSDFRPSS